MPVVPPAPVVHAARVCQSLPKVPNIAPVRGRRARQVPRANSKKRQTTREARSQTGSTEMASACKGVRYPSLNPFRVTSPEDAPLAPLAYARGLPPPRAPWLPSRTPIEAKIREWGEEPHSKTIPCAFLTNAEPKLMNVLRKINISWGVGHPSKTQEELGNE